MPITSVKVLLQISSKMAIYHYGVVADRPGIVDLYIETNFQPGDYCPMGDDKLPHQFPNSFFSLRMREKIVIVSLEELMKRAANYNTGAQPFDKFAA